MVKEKTVFDWLDDDVSERDVFFYKYPDYKKLEEAGVQSIYLGHFVKWYGRQNYEFVVPRGFTGRRAGPLPGNYLDYDNIDEKLCEINIWFKYLKFGFWRATDQTCYDIWNDRLTREEAVKIVNELQDEKPFNDLEDFLNFHMITREQFDETVEKFLNKEIWDCVDGVWELKYRVK
ncbi:putative LPS biosynthesis protein [Vibrio cholerae]|nr:putative monosaccharide biosynthesis protein [Vibrio cholerae]GHZ08783.1 putative LPS biosynthesis protein [Vibrio cholerae]